LLGLVADLRNVPGAGLTPREADEALAGLGAGEATRRDLQSILESLESMAYGGASLPDAEALTRQAEALALRANQEVGRRRQP
jgi:hypothetical protein